MMSSLHQLACVTRDAMQEDRGKLWLESGNTQAGPSSPSNYETMT